MADKTFLEFLGFPLLVNVIDPDTGLTGGQTCNNAEEVHAYVEANSGKNIYYAPNPTRAPINKKAKRTDLACVRFFHADLDPGKDENPEDARERLLSSLRNPPAGIPGPPTAIISSGNGYNALWAIEEPLPLTSWDEINDATSYNLAICSFLDGDTGTHNVDRILRMPGTLNIPDERKKARGRVEVMAELVEIHPERVYRADQFKRYAAAPPSQNFDVEVPANVQRVTDIADLGLKDWVNELIVHGYPLDDPDKYGGDRSTALFAAVCAMHKAGLSDEVIYSVITDDFFKISESVLDKRDVERYATRQIARAKEAAIDPNLEMMNSEYAVIENFGGKPLVIRETVDAEGNPKRDDFSFKSLMDIKMNVPVVVGEDSKGNPKTKGIGSWWLAHPLRRTYRTMEFLPGRSVEGVYNLWQGFAVDPVAGNKHESFLEHLETNVCGRNEEHYEYLINWLCWTVQKLDQQSYTAVVMQGDQGTGKGTVAKTLGRLFGSHFMQVTNPEHVVGKHNSHLQDTRVLFADEAFYAGDKKHIGTLKGLITEETIPIEPKFHKVIHAKNHLCIIMASNEDWVVPAELSDRRFFVLEVKSVRDKAYFRAIYDDLENGGYQSLLHFLLTRDISKFNIRDIPQTEALARQKELSAGPEFEWWKERLWNGTLVNRHNEWEREVVRDELQEDFIQYIENNYPSYRRRLTKNKMLEFLKDVTGGRVRVRQLNEEMEFADRRGNFHVKTRPYVYSFPDLQTCREMYEELFGIGVEWDH